MARIDEHLVSLETLSSTALKEAWCRLTGTPLPRISPKLLRLALAWELQARAYGGHSRETIRKLGNRMRPEDARQGKFLIIAIELSREAAGRRIIQLSSLSSARSTPKHPIPAS